MKRFLGVAVLAAAVAAGSTAQGQTTYSLSVSGATTHDINSNFDMSVLIDTSAGINLAGWSYGLCHDAALFDITGVANGATTLTVKNGALPDFNNINMIPGSGFTVGVVICFTGCASLAPGSGHELNVASYHAGAAEGLGDLNFCDTLGIPPVSTVVVEGGLSVTPSTQGLVLEFSAPPPASFDYIAPDMSANFDAASGLGALSAQFSILEDAASPGFPNTSQGFSMGLSHDSAILSITAGPVPILPFSPDFIGPGVSANGWTIGVVYSFAGQNTLNFTVATPVISVDYGISGLAGSPDTSTPLTWSNSLGNPAVSNVVVVGGLSLDANFDDGLIQLFGITDTPFVRADCNSDLRIDIADGIWILNDLFQGGASGVCAEACDADDSGSLDMIDAIYIFQYRLLNGPAPVAPFPACGIDAGAVCDTSSCQ